MLIQLGHDLIVNTDHIVSVADAQALNSAPRIEVTLSDGTRKFMFGSTERLEWCTGLVIPAPPGFEIIQAYVGDDDVVTFDQIPVIAFRLTDSEPVPVSALGRLAENWALVWPDGRCDEQWNQLFPSVAAYKASFGPKGVRS